jgi:hypothetical protein
LRPLTRTIFQVWRLNMRFGPVYSLSDRWSAKLRRWFGLSVMLCVAGVYCAPVLLTYFANGEQDQCTFGPVSNEGYRAYFQKAAVLSSETPGSFSWDDLKASTRLDQLFEKMIDGNPSVYEGGCVPRVTAFVRSSISKH